MPARRYRKKPVEVEAIQYDGKNAVEVLLWACSDVTEAFEGGLVIGTLEGPIHASVGDYIVRGVRGELYPVKPDIFEETYEAVTDEG